MKNLTCEERLKDMIVIDKQNIPQKINKLLKSEILYLFRNYFDVTAEDIDVNIDIDEYGKYHIDIRALARNIKSVHLFG